MNEYNEACDLWIKNEQLDLKEQSNYAKIECSLKLFNDENGFVRLKGRYENSSLDYDEKFPVLLRSYFTKLIFLDAHKIAMHHGVESTLNHLRSNFWIIKGRKTVKDILRKCVLCKKNQGQTMLSPDSPDLPAYRVNSLLNCFQATGLDYAGPLFVRDQISKNVSKVYVLLLTCASSRAIHLELTPDMKISAFLRGFIRFTSRRGTHDVIVNDNLKTFKSAKVKRFMMQRGVAQRFILPISPWCGGFYERMVCSVKSTLKKVLGKAIVTFEELQTILCEIEEVLKVVLFTLVRTIFMKV